MPTPKKGKRLGGSPAHQRLILANQATQLFENHRITTTETKARLLRPYAEKLITLAKRGDLHSRRLAAEKIRNKSVLHFLFTDIAPQMANRDGGYTRITKIGNRKGDNAPMAVIELVLEPVSPKQAVVKEAQKATEKAAPAQEKPAEEAAPEAPVEDAAEEKPELALETEAEEEAENK